MRVTPGKPYLCPVCGKYSVEPTWQRIVLFFVNWSIMWVYLMPLIRTDLRKFLCLLPVWICYYALTLCLFRFRPVPPPIPDLRS
jgi:hypothetical protein